MLASFETAHTSAPDLLVGSPPRHWGVGTPLSSYVERGATDQVVSMRALLSAALLATCCIAHAAPTYDVSITLRDLSIEGNTLTPLGEPGDLITVTGDFAATDLDLNGFLTTDELITVHVWGDLLAYPWSLHEEGAPIPWFSGYANITYELATGELSFYAWNFDSSNLSVMSIHPGEAYAAVQAAHGAGGLASFKEGVTSVEIAAAVRPVPEPTTFGLTAAGLIVLLLWLRRRRSIGRR